MKIHLITVGEPKLPYAKNGWELYAARLKHYHDVRVTHIRDKKAYDQAAIMDSAGNGYKVALEVDGTSFSSPELAQFLEKQAQNGRELCFIIGGPEGLPAGVRAAADAVWSLSSLTFPHDLAMLVVLEALYRASTINAGQPYHK